ncbi:MAG: CHASE2 domain-containing protein, partial [Pseudomonadota bacterium]
MRKVFLVLAVALIAGLAAIRGFDPTPVAQTREAYFDYLQRLAPRPLLPLPIRIIDIDEASLAAEGQWPWPRHRLAQMVDALADMGAAVIAFDVLFPEPDRLSAAQVFEDPRVGAVLGALPSADVLATLDNDERFAAAIEGFPVVLGVADAGGDDAGALIPPKSGFVEVGLSRPSEALLKMRGTTAIVPPLLAVGEGIGSINVSPFEDEGRVREVPLVWRSEGGMIPSLAVEALRLALGESTIVLMGTDSNEAAIRAVRVGGYYIPTNSEGALRVRYRNDDPETYVPAGAVLNPDAFAEIAPLIEGHIVFVGTSAAGLLDIRATPLGETVPGVSIHAQILEQILLEDYLQRNDILAGIEILTFLVIGGILAVLLA